MLSLSRSSIIFIVCDCILSSIHSSSYIHTRLEEECPGSKKLKIRLQSEVNLITFNSSQFPGSSLHCHLELSVPSTQYGLAVFIEEMQLGSCSRDYVQFGRKILFVTSHLSSRYCGRHAPPRVVTTEEGVTRHSLDPATAANRYYTEDSDHEMEVWVVVGDTGPAAAKQLTLVVTPFKKSCSARDASYVQCANSRHCVRKDLFCDGRVNCAWPHTALPADESQCQEVRPVVEQEPGDSTTGVTVSVLVLLAALLSAAGLLLYRHTHCSAPRPKQSSQLVTRQLQGQEDLLTTELCGPQPPPPYAPPATPPPPPPAPPRQPPRYEVIWT